MHVRLLRILVGLTLAHPASAEIIPPEPPPGHEALIKNWLGAERSAVEHLIGRPAGEIRIGAGVRRYGVGPVLRDDEEFVSRMIAGSWMFPVYNDNAPAGFAVLAPAEPDKNWHVAGFVAPEPAVEFLKAYEIAARLPQVVAGRYEARMATIHEEMIEVLWLHSPDEDLFIPHGRPYPTSRWRPFEVHSQKEIIAASPTKATWLKNRLSFGVGPLSRLLRTYRQQAEKSGDTRPATFELLKAALNDEVSLAMLESAEREMSRRRIRYHPSGPASAPGDFIATLQEADCLAAVTVDGTFTFYREQPSE